MRRTTLLLTTATTIAALAGPFAPDAAGADVLRVGVAGSSPFVTTGERGELAGVSVEIWKQVAEELKLEYRLVPLPSMAELIQAVSTGSVAVGVGPISITASRALLVDFTQPYYEAGMGVLAPPRASALWVRIRPFVSRGFLIAVASLLLILFGVGNLLWFFERRHNAAQFPADYKEGVANGMWFALVTMTTVGYGDRVPATAAGRVVTGAWMIFSMIAASSLTAGIATALTLANLESADETSAIHLADRRVAVVRGTSAAGVAVRHQARVVEAPTRDEAVQMVLDGRADAVLGDSPVLRHWLHQHGDSPLVLSDAKVATQDYGFAVPNGSTLRRHLDRAILTLWEEQRIQTILDRWLTGRQ